MNEGFTKGPWDAGSRIVTIEGSDLTPIDAPERAVAFVPAGLVADANLIAAAPALYEALRTLFDYIEDVALGHAIYDDPKMPEIRAMAQDDLEHVTALLAQARGDLVDPSEVKS